MLVVDASVAFSASRAEEGFARLGDDDLHAPGLMWPEARSALHEAMWRGDLHRSDARAALARLERAPVAQDGPDVLGEEAWRLADDFGWAKTYDAEYVALAQILGCRLVTLDGRLWRGTRRLGFVVSPTEL